MTFDGRSGDGGGGKDQKVIGFKELDPVTLEPEYRRDEDGNEYPLFKVEIPNTSHPFYTGKMNFVDTAGRIDKFNKRYAKKK